MKKPIPTLRYMYPRLGPALLGVAVVAMSGCNGATGAAPAAVSAVEVGVTPVVRKTLVHQLNISSELVPEQQIDVYAKESGFVQSLAVDYGSRVKKGDIIAILEIPELQAQLQQDEARIKTESDEVSRVSKEISRYKAVDDAIHKEYDRLNQVMITQPGLVAQQEVDDAQSKDLAAASQVDAAEAQLSAAQGELAMAQAQLTHDQALFAYSRITAPFSGVVTQRYANLGTLVQGGTNSSTQALPLVQLSEDDVFRLVIPVPETYVRYIAIGEPVTVRIPSLGSTFPGKVARFSDDIKDDTRTMHTEVEVRNPTGVLKPGLFAEADLTLEKHDNVLSVPLLAVDSSTATPSVMVVNSAGVIEVRPVTLGLQTDTDAEVTSGLREGDRVVVSDRSGLKAGETVKAQDVPQLGMPAQTQN